jgi:CRISPR-associated protein Csm5
MPNEKQPKTGKRVWVNPNAAPRAVATGPRSAGNSGQQKPRQWNGKGFIPFRLEVLTPVHIGSGDTLSPLEYVLRQHEDSWRLYRLDMRTWFEEYGQDSAVRDAVESTDLKRIQLVVNEKSGPHAEDAERLALFSCRIPDASLAKTLQGALDRKSGKKGEVSAILRNPADGSVCLPGSSLKGALSTPLIDWRDKEQSGDNLGGYLRKAFTQGGRSKDQQREYRNRLEKMFGKIREHAMQALKVSDLLAPPDICAIVKAEEKRLKESAKESTPKNACEVIPTGTTLYGRLLFDSASGGPLIQGRRWQLDFNTLRKLCNDYYRKRFTAERKTFYTLPHLKYVDAALQPIANKLAALNGEHPPLLLRVGHYSHVESVTVDANAPKGRTFEKNDGSRTSPVFGTTRTLANGELPFGWVLLHFCTPEEYADGVLQTEVDIENAVTERRSRAQEAVEQAQRKAEEAERLRRETEARQAEEENRRKEEEERLAAMTPEEREIDAVVSLRATEYDSNELYKKLGELDKNMQLKAAKALQAFWKKLGKWEGTALSKKQKAKVQAVKALLAENGQGQ